MDKKYKIGSISKLLGISSQTLHYYEDCGFVTPEKDGTSKYRYYDTWDVNFLLDCKYYQSLGFNNRQVKKMIQQDSISDIYDKMEQRESEILNEIYEREKLLGILRHDKLKLQSVSSKIGVFTETSSQASFVKFYRTNNEFDNLDRLTIKDMIDYLPQAQATFVIPVENNLMRDTSCEDILKNYKWGFSFTPGDVRELSFDTKSMEYFPPKKCLYTVFKAYGENTFASSIANEVIRPLLHQGYQITGSLIGKLIVRTNRDDQFTRYFEIWIPI